jgi:hypothetical protein
MSETREREKDMTEPTRLVTKEETENWWGPYFPMGKVSRISGPPGSGKTDLALGLGCAIGAGVEFLGNACRRGRVLWVTTEALEDGDLVGRAWRVAHGMGLDSYGMTISRLKGRLSTISMQDKLRLEIKKAQADFVILRAVAGRPLAEVRELAGRLRAWEMSALIIDRGAAELLPIVSGDELKLTRAPGGGYHLGPGDLQLERERRRRMAQVHDVA